MILDCPSGAGKTLTGVALSLKDCRRNPDSRFGSTPMAVFHFIWPDAVEDQDIYKDITSKSNVHRVFFERVALFDFQAWKRATNQYKYTWNNLLEALFPDEELEEYKSLRKSVLLIIDEVPEDPVGVQKLGELREAVKVIPNVCLILSGTNAKAANMVGLTQGVASRVDTEGEPILWAYIVTRLPQFVLELSDFHESFERLSLHPLYRLVVNAIQLSISSGGNPFLISIGIRIAYKLLLGDLPVPSGIFVTQELIFHVWQQEFSKSVAKSKFSFASYTRLFKGLVGQLNLLLEASATSDLSDAMLGHHFASRAIPDGCKTFSSVKGIGMDACSSCLWLSSSEDRARGLNLHVLIRKSRETGAQSNRYVRDSQEPFYLWQTSCFPPPHTDILIYLMACRVGGYYCSYVQGSFVSYRTHQVLLPVWRSNSAGLVNFQNPSAIANSNSFLEILVAAAVPNAAAKANQVSYAHRGKCTGVGFFQELAQELGININRLSNFADFMFDNTLSSICVPEYIFPGKERMLLNAIQSPSLRVLLGVVERQAASEKCDLLLKSLGSSPAETIAIDAKDRVRLNAADVKIATEKLFQDGRHVGVLVVRNCNSYWGNGPRDEMNRLTLKEDLQGIPNLGKAFLISRLGKVMTVTICDGLPGRLILLQLSDFVLREPKLGATSVVAVKATG